jgi:mono/diheme cytochrome c family protein
VILLFASPAACTHGDDPPLDFSAAHRALAAHCGDCHGESDGEGDFSLAPLDSPPSLVDASDQWRRVRSRLADGSMPPEDAEPLPLDERKQLVAWLDAATRDAFLQQDEQPGPPLLRRLTAREYSNTIRDLLSVHYDAGRAWPQDVAGGEGFTNAAETLTISPIHGEKFLSAAIEALRYAESDSAARAALLVRRPGADASELDAARANLTALADRAFRRPVKVAEVAPYLKLFKDARADGLSFDDATFYAMRGVLTSPNFLFLSESSLGRPGAIAPLTGPELASRLSYFLWASMPDRALREAADAGRLSGGEELRNQTLRLLGDVDHLSDMLTEFVGQWLGTADLGRAKQVAPKRAPWIQDHHVASLRDQPTYVFGAVLRENRSLLELIDSDWTYLNDLLLQVYQLDRGKIEAKEFNQNLQKMTLPEEYRRHCGLIGAGGPMVLASYPQRTSPVLRGVWVLDKMLGVKLPPPPPNVPKLSETAAASAAATLRQRFEQHRADPACASCHDRIDPIGFALENFDELGAWRTRDAGGEIDAVARLRGGIEIDGVAGLKRYLLENKTQFVRHLTEKMLGYALARSLRPTDRATVERIVARLEASDYRAQELVLGIVESTPFRMKRREE